MDILEFGDTSGHVCYFRLHLGKIRYVVYVITTPIFDQHLHESNDGRFPGLEVRHGNLGTPYGVGNILYRAELRKS